MLVVLIACDSKHVKFKQDADTSDAPPMKPRFSSAALVDATRVTWGLAPNCTVVSPCTTIDTSIAQATLANPSATPVHLSVAGVRWLGGDPRELFFVATDTGGEHLARLRPDTDAQPIAMSPPFDGSGPPTAIAIETDATSVYWFSPNNGIMRASRTGDGSDAQLVASTIDTGPPEHITIFNGFVWWSNWSTLFRVPLAGGNPQTVSSNARLVGASPTELFVASPMGNIQRISGIDAAGTWRTITDASTSDPMRFFVYADTELYWNGMNAVFRVPITGGVATPVGTLPSAPFAVTADKVLFGFTRDGFQSIPR